MKLIWRKHIDWFSNWHIPYYQLCADLLPQNCMHLCQLYFVFFLYFLFFFLRKERQNLLSIFIEYWQKCQRLRYNNLHAIQVVFLPPYVWLTIHPISWFPGSYPRTQTVSSVSSPHHITCVLHDTSLLPP